MFYQLPPAGNPIVLSSEVHPALSLEQVFSPYQARYYASGTAALAAAITAALRLKDIDKPEVILPAYGCPDLVSAVIFSGATPVLVDLEPDRPWISLGKLQESINTSTVAIIATNLFGISERVAEIKLIAEQSGVVVIEDSAQAFPVGHETGFWQGDLVVLSFGRGKPVSLLGGGAVLYTQPISATLLPEGESHKTGSNAKQGFFPAKARLYNAMIHPRLYWLPQSLPFLHLGETRYHPLFAIEGMDQARLSILAANIAAYQDYESGIQEAVSEMLAELSSVVGGLLDLPVLCQVSRQRRLLRYPLLVGSGMRDELYRRLRKAGLGPSVMYPAILPGIPDVEGVQSGEGAYPAAEAFSARLLTLPTHGRVRMRDVTIMGEVLRSVA